MCISFSIEKIRSFSTSAVFMILTITGPVTLNQFFAQANAQVTGGTISGAVKNDSGLAVPNAQINTKDVKSGATKVMTTDLAGLYAFSELSPASYDMTVSAVGFKTQALTAITLAVGDKLAINLTIKAGNPKDVIRIQALPAQANQATSTVEGNVNSSTVRNAPLNGRDWTQLATLG